MELKLHFNSCQNIHFYRNSFPWSVVSFSLTFLKDWEVHCRESNLDLCHEWMIIDASMYAPLYEENYEKINLYNVYQPKVKCTEFEIETDYKGSAILSNFELPLEKIPLFFWGIGIVVGKAPECLKTRIFPIAQHAATVFYDKDDETASFISIENPDWDNIVLTDETTTNRVSGMWIRHAYEFILTPGHNYSVK